MIWKGRLGTVRLTGNDIGKLREACYRRDDGMCVVCLRRLTLKTMHMAHIKARGAGGADTLDNVVTKCAHCHLVKEHNPRSVPKRRYR